jgi:chitodextrinase
MSPNTLRAAALLALVLLLLSFSPVIAAGSDRKAPTRPTNLRVTGVTSYSVALAWSPSTDNSGVFSYKVRASYGQTWTVPQTQTTFNWNFGLVPGHNYSFYVYAVDGSGNKSLNSNTITAFVPPDTTPPTPPALTLVDVNPTEVSLAWTASTDDGPHLMYQVYVDGNPDVDAWTSRAAVVHNLSPEATYTLTVRARDFYGNNVSAPSNAITVTTPAVEPEDGEAPPPAANLIGQAMDCAEVWLSWTESFDNQTPQSALRYDVFVNGVFDHSLLGADRTILYGTTGGDNTFTVITVDVAGNQSTPANAVVTLC